MKKMWVIISVLACGVGLTLILGKRHLESSSDTRSSPSTMMSTPLIESGQFDAWPGHIRLETLADGPNAIQLTKQLVAPNIGEISRNELGQCLSVNDRVVFCGKEIKRSVNAGSKIVVCAITGEMPSVDRADVDINGKLEASYHEIWVIGNSKAHPLLSSRSLDSINPIVSQDGDMLVFSARKILSNGMRSGARLYIAVISKNMCNVINLDNLPSDCSISPVAWEKSGFAFSVLINSGETGGHEQLRRVILEMP